MSAAKPLCLIAAGGTGGHMFPAQSLAEVLLGQGWRVKLSTDERGARYAGNFPAEVPREVVSSATTARGGLAAACVAWQSRQTASPAGAACGSWHSWQAWACGMCRAASST